MSESSKRKLALACCAAISLAFAACDDDSGSSNQQNGIKCGDNVCTETQECVEGVCKDKTAEDPCAKCTDGQKCVNQVCKDLCGSEVCTDAQICDTESHTCIDKEAAEDPCRKIVCGAAQTCIKAHCIDDACLEDGVEKSCGEGKVCSKGECIDDGCEGKTCNDGWQCIKGICEETACIDKFCAEGKSCKAGACVDNECLDKSCDAGTVCAKGSCIFEACVDKDPCTAGKSCNASGVCEFIAAPAITLDKPADTASDESGKTVSLPLHINNAPTQEVRVTCEIITESPNPEVTVACEEIVFNSDNWQLEQTIVITGVQDYLIDGDQTYKINVKTISDDPDFNDLTAESVELKNIDTTKPGFVLSEKALTTYEDQEQPPATFDAKLTSKPSADVNVVLMSSNAQEGIAKPAKLVFTPENWNTPQTVTVQGLDDDREDGTQSYKITLTPSSADESYDNAAPAFVKAINVDNDVAGITVSIHDDKYEILEGVEDKLQVRLNTRPEKPVTVKITVDSGETQEAKVDLAELEFTPDAWNTPKEITFSGIHDHIIDGNKPFKLSFKSESEDAAYKLSLDYEGEVIDIDKGEALINMGETPIVREGSDDSFTVSLSLYAIPKSPVQVDISVSDESELQVKTDKVVNFTKDNWNEVHEIKVSAVDDVIIDGDVKSNLILKLTSEDKDFNGKTNEIEFTTVDNDVAGFVIASEATIFSEDGGSNEFTVKLSAQPQADVTVTVSSTDVSELAVVSANTLTFTSENWNVPQTVKVEAVDDNTADGAQIVQVKFEGKSEDEHFDGIEGLSADYTISDNDANSIVLTADPTTLPLGSPSSTAKLKLGAQPLSDVTVTFAVVSGSNVLTFTPSSLTFTAENWDKEQTVAIAADMSLITSASSVESIYAAGSGGGYSKVQSNKVDLNLVKIPIVQNFSYTGKVQSVSLPQGKYKLEVWGAQGGYVPDSNSSLRGGNGGYSTGVLTLTSPKTLYVYVGNIGDKKASNCSEYPDAGWNGGGREAYSCHGGAGGGATDIALYGTAGSSEWYNDDHLYSRIIVAGGGGGLDWDYDTSITCGVGGGLSGTVGTTLNNATPGTQTGPGTGGASQGYAASFGRGGSDASNGGGGWYGGAADRDTTCGAGGSGYVYTSATAVNYPA
ncbi:MAG: hypothetical protein IKY83_01685, partial [Proteobacteria bacterium]|nr:hypothetical protein [Pseudomonadota bacterium]